MKRRLLVIPVSLGLLVGAFLLALTSGSVPVSFADIYHLVSGKGEVEGLLQTVVFQIRLPRALAALAVGANLALSGAILQGLFRNPLVEPYTLGISGGAALAVALILLFGKNYLSFSMFFLPISGFLGAFMVIFILYYLSSRRGILNLNRLLLFGVMISFLTSALIMFLIALSDIKDLQPFLFWLMGSLEISDESFLKPLLVSSFLGGLWAFFLAVPLNAFLLGEEEALHLGVEVERVKKFFFFLASFLTGVSVSVAGVIGFVGLLVPHILRLFVGWDYRFLLPGAYLSGAAFLLLCDTLARTLFRPAELPVGVITGLLGATLFIILLIKKEPWKE